MNINKRKLEDLLDELEIPIKFLGYKYWLDAVDLYANNKSNKTRALYDEIAKLHNTTSIGVERGMRLCYSKKIDKIKKRFGINYRITNKSLLALLTREMERNNEK